MRRSERGAGGFERSPLRPTQCAVGRTSADRAAEILEGEHRVLHEAEGLVRAREAVGPAADRCVCSGRGHLGLDGRAGGIVVAAERRDHAVALQRSPDQLGAHRALWTASATTSESTTPGRSTVILPGRRTTSTDGSPVPGSFSAIAWAIFSFETSSTAKPACALCAPARAAFNASGSPGACDA